MPHDEAGGMDKSMRDCIAACSSCHDVCTQTVQHCLMLGGEHAVPTHIAMLLDCAEICHTSADFMLRESGRASHVCRVCAEICRACEAECRRMGDDSHMRKCADACRACAESCGRMAGATH